MKRLEVPDERIGKRLAAYLDDGKARWEGRKIRPLSRACGSRKEGCLSAALNALRLIQCAHYRHKTNTSKHSLVLSVPTKWLPPQIAMGANVSPSSFPHLPGGFSHRRLTHHRVVTGHPGFVAGTLTSGSIGFIRLSFDVKCKKQWLTSSLYSSYHRGATSISARSMRST